MIKITRHFEFDMGHRVLGHESKCAYLHGHRYGADITVTAEELDSIDRVIDFSEVKRIVGKWIDDNWDHNVMLHINDPLLRAYVPEDGMSWDEWIDDGPQSVMKLSTFSGPLTGLTSEPIFNGRLPFIVPDCQNTTAEIIAKVLFEKATELLSPCEIQVVEVRINETPNCWAVYNLEMNNASSR